MCKRMETLSNDVLHYLIERGDWCCITDIAYEFRTTIREVAYAISTLDNIEKKLSPEYRGKRLYRYEATKAD